MKNTNANHRPALYRIGSFLLCAALSSHALAISPYTATYTFNLDNKASGTAIRQLSKQANTDWLYHFSARIPILATATEQSLFSFDNQQVHSKKFSREYKILIHKQRLSFDFDHTKHMVNVKKDKDARHYALLANTLDDLNAEIQIREDLKRKQLKSSYLIANKKGIDKRDFVNGGAANISTPAGQFSTIKVIIKHPKKHERNTTFWLAPKLDYLPVKVVHTDDKQTYELSLTHYKPN